MEILAFVGGTALVFLLGRVLELSARAAEQGTTHANPVRLYSRLR